MDARTSTLAEGSSSPDYGARDLHEELERYRRMSIETLEQLQATVKLKKHREKTEMNDEMSRISDPLSPIPEAPDNTEMIEQELRECTGIGFAKAKDCTLENELGEAIRTCKIVRQRIEVLLAEAAELTKLLEEAAETDSDDETGSARTSRN